MSVTMPSFTLIISCIFAAYVGHSIYTFSRIFVTPGCTKDPCFQSYLEAADPELQLVLFTSAKANPISSEVHLLDALTEFDYHKEFVR